MKPLAIYIHVPFCKRKCAYCDFYSMVPQNDELVARYVNALIAHMQSYRQGTKEYYVDTVFIGGGTPTSIPPPVRPGRPWRTWTARS